MKVFYRVIKGSTNSERLPDICRIREARKGIYGGASHLRDFVR